LPLPLPLLLPLLLPLPLPLPLLLPLLLPLPLPLPLRRSSVCPRPHRPQLGHTETRKPRGGDPRGELRESGD
jgi:hypothetical protein